MPYGGARQLTPMQSMIAKLPVMGETRTCSAMAYGFEPRVSEQSPYLGAYLAVVESAARLVASGMGHEHIYMGFQEYFERLRTEPERWGKPFAALLGALEAQIGLGMAAIGGKDSMSGSFEDMDVPPTLVSFAVTPGNVDDVITPELKAAGDRLALLYADPFDAEATLRMFAEAESLMRAGKVRAAWAVGSGGVAEGLCKMAFGNGLGVEIDPGFDAAKLFGWRFGGMILETVPGCEAGETIGRVGADYVFRCGGEHADLGAYVDELGCTLGEELLRPTKIYAKPVLAAMDVADVHGVSHITGGGFYENIPRCIPDGLCAKIDKSSLRTPPIFSMLQRMGSIPEHDMFNTYNMGVGMTMIVAKDDADKALAALKENGQDAYVIGEVVSGEEKVALC